MRYCHRFPGGIPHPRVDSHVFLTRPPLPVLAHRAFDLHVLGTPPAFILSQDQTRHPICIKNSNYVELVFVCKLRCSRSWPWYKNMAMFVADVTVWSLSLGDRTELTRTGVSYIQFHCCFPLFSCQGADRERCVHCCFSYWSSIAYRLVFVKYFLDQISLRLSSSFFIPGASHGSHFPVFETKSPNDPE